VLEADAVVGEAPAAAPSDDETEAGAPVAEDGAFFDKEALGGKKKGRSGAGGVKRKAPAAAAPAELK
jgi:hypothetical protein